MCGVTNSEHWKGFFFKGRGCCKALTWGRIGLERSQLPTYWPLKKDVVLFGGFLSNL